MKWTGKLTLNEKACFQRVAPIGYDQLFLEVSPGNYLVKSWCFIRIFLILANSFAYICYK